MAKPRLIREITLSGFTGDAWDGAPASFEDNPSGIKGHLSTSGGEAGYEFTVLFAEADDTHVTNDATFSCRMVERWTDENSKVRIHRSAVKSGSVGIPVEFKPSSKGASRGPAEVTLEVTTDFTIPSTGDEIKAQIFGRAV